MNVIERVFALRVTPPFDRLYDSEIAQIAKAASIREFAAGESVATADRQAALIDDAAVGKKVSR